jgi:hypothetical protein
MERAMKTIAKATTAALFLLAASPLAQARQKGVELGMLECTISGGIGMIVSSKKELTCSFRPADQNFAPEAYLGTDTNHGHDTGATGKPVMQFL